MTELFAAALLAGLIIALLVAGGRLRVAREFTSRPRMTAALALLWLVLLTAVAMPTVLSGSGEVVTADIRFPELFAGHAVLAGFLVAWWTLRRPIPLASFLHLRRAGVEDVPGGIALGLRVWLYTFGAAALAGVVLQLLAAAGDGVAVGPVEIAEVPDVMIWMAELPVANKLLIVLAAMTVEEAFFRSFLQSRIGLVPSSILFAAGHASYGMPTLMFGVFVVSIVIGRDFAKHRQLLRSILAHGVFDAIQLLFVVPFAVRQLQQLP